MLSVEKRHKRSVDIYSKAESKARRVAELFRRYGIEIYSIICFNLDDFSRADDIFQELFLTFLQNPIPSNTENIKAYIYKTITNDILDTVRQKKSEQDRIARYVRGQQNRMIGRNPEKTIIRAEQIKRLFGVIEAELPHRQTEAILLRYVDNCSLDEIAEQMKVNKATVSRYVWAGLKKVRELLYESQLEANVY